MRSLLREYLKIEKPVFFAIVAEFFLQLINASFMTIQPLYLKSEHFSDGQCADFISYRFLGVLLFALPLGLIIKGRKLKNMFIISSLMVPLFSILIIYAINIHHLFLIYCSQFLWGSSFAFIQIAILPYILRNAKLETQIGAIALSYSTYSFGSIVSGCMIALFNFIDPIFFNEKNILFLISFLGFFSFYFILKIKPHETVPSITKKRRDISDFDWKIIFKALTPTLIIAIGAGLTIPFISLFFANVHHMTTGDIGLLNSIASILVALGAFYVPKIKREIGYTVAIPLTQSLAIVALILLATTQYYNELPFAIYVAIACFLLRQPLMNMAGPMTSDVVMSYVGKRNQEMVSALTSAIWSGSWFISSLIFMVLRNEGFAYVNVFMITAYIYIVGVIWYYFLVKAYAKRMVKEASC